jgi:hypothetical protein
LGAILVPIGTLVLGSYGWGLFAAIPFAQGAIAAFASSIHRERTLRQCMLVALLSIAVTCAALLALAVEGVVCIAMAAPIAAAFAALGALFGYACRSPASSTERRDCRSLFALGTDDHGRGKDRVALGTDL